MKINYNLLVKFFNILTGVFFIGFLLINIPEVNRYIKSNSPATAAGKIENGRRNGYNTICDTSKGFIIIYDRYYIEGFTRGLEEGRKGCKKD